MKVLLAHDGRPPSDESCELLAKIVDKNRVDVTVLCVESFDMALEVGARTEGRYSPEAGRKNAESIVEKAVGQLEGRGFRVTGLVEEGYPPSEILQQATAGGYALVVLGSGKSGLLRGASLGSVSTKVLHASPTSVMIVHEVEADRGGGVLVGIDGSAESESAVRAVGELCDPERVDVRLSAVVKLADAVSLADDWSRLVSKGRDELLTQLRRRSDQDLARARKSLETKGFVVSSSLVEGNPRERLLEQAEETRADVVAVGARGRTGLERVLLGSVTDGIVRHAPATIVGRSAK